MGTYPLTAPEPGWPTNPAWSGLHQCAAKSKQTGKRCERPVTPGMAVCDDHGGKSLVGPALPSYKTGVHSRLTAAMGRRLAENVDAIASEPDNLPYSAEIATVYGYLIDAIDRCDKGESGELLKAIKEGATAAQKCVFAVKKDPTTDTWRDATDALDNLLLHINAAEADYAARAEVREWIDLLGKTKEREIKRREKAQEYVGIASLKVCTDMCMAFVRRRVTDKKEVAAVERDYYQWLIKFLRGRSGEGRGDAHGAEGDALRPVDTDEG